MAILWLPLILVLPYFILLIRLCRPLARINSFVPKQEPSLALSVIIPCRNEAENITSLLNSLAAQDYSRDLFEVIVVDDNSSDNTSDRVSSFSFPGNLRVIRNQGEGKKAALLTGVKNATNECIVTTDADCITGNAWLRTIAAFFQEADPSLIIAPVRLNGGKGFAGRFQELEFLSLQAVTAATALTGRAVMCNGANLAFTRKIYLQHSADLHPELNTGDDMFLLHSVGRNRGNRIVWLESEAAVVVAAAAGGIPAFLRQRKRWISKWNNYNDLYTNLTGIIVFLAVCGQLILTLLAPAIPSVFIPLAIFLSIKSVPDYFLLRNTSLRYGRKHLLRWFIPSQVIYPFYVFAVLLTLLLSGRRKTG